jgi:phosphoribosylanthranilate isomerase
MSIWIKICGNTSLDDARMAAEAGADAVGFVFAESPRHVTASEAAAIVHHLPEAVEKIGVFVDASLEEIYSTVRSCGLTGVQLHFDASPDLPARLKQRLGPQLRVLRVVHFAEGTAESHIDQLAHSSNFDAVLIDSRTATAAGGTGVAFDWALAGKTLFKKLKAHKCIAAGGLNAKNVAEAIATLRPWGVDVVSGVEAAPGKKDPEKVRQFVACARATRRKRK